MTQGLNEAPVGCKKSVSREMAAIEPTPARLRRWIMNHRRIGPDRVLPSPAQWPCPAALMVSSDQRTAISFFAAPSRAFGSFNV